MKLIKGLGLFWFVGMVYLEYFLKTKVILRYNIFVLLKPILCTDPSYNHA